MPAPTDEEIAQILGQIHERVTRLLRRCGRLPEDPSPTDPVVWSRAGAVPHRDRLQPLPDDDMTDCKTTSPFAAVATGSRSSCVSSDGAFDMVGNLYEWVADWVPRATACGSWSAGVSPTGDDQCLAGAATTGEPGALLRGGSFVSGTGAGPLAVAANNAPSDPLNAIGFRCAR